MATNSRENSRRGRISRETSGRIAYVGEISPIIASARSNTGEISVSILVQRQREISMATNPRENSRRGRISREISGRIAYVGEILPIIASARTNTGGTSGSISIQRQRETSMATNSRENSRWGRISRETSERLACVGAISPATVFVRTNTGETSRSSSAQLQKETSMATNQRENSREGRISRETSGKLAYVGEISPIIASARTNTRESSGSSSIQRQRETSMAKNSRESSRG